MKKIVLVGLLALAACAPAQSGNSPAEQVFNQASSLLQDQYFGFSLEQLPAILLKGKADLQKACADSGSGCKAEVAQKIIDTMINQLDDAHTFLETPAVFAESQRTRAGQGGSFPILGVRSVYRPKSNGRLITESLPTMAAESAGLTRGDMIVGINGKPLPVGDNESALALRDSVRSGQEFIVNVRRAGQNREVKVTGRLATVPALPSLKTWATLPSSIALIRVPDYVPPQTAEMVHKLINQAAKNGAKSLILDFRGNTGGAASNCISVAGAFLGRTGTIFASKASRESYIYENGVVAGSNGARVRVSEIGAFTGGVASLVDQNSASCAEITPALLQTAKRGIVIGEPSYGILNTGSQTFPLQDGSGLSITTIRTLDLNGVALPTRVTPNIAQIEDYDALENNARDVMLERAIRALQGQATTLEKNFKPNSNQPSLLELRNAWN